MKVTVISDTHMPRKAKALPKQVLDSILRTDAVIHAGDFTEIEVLEELEILSKRVEAVTGNNDGFEILMRLGRQKVIEMAGYKIGIIHGDGASYGSTPNRAKIAFKDEKVDIVIFGHSHQAFKEWDNGVLYLNPGSPTDKRRSPKFSFAELNLKDKIEAKIYYF